MRLALWSADEREVFLRSQFDAQATHYRTHYASALYQIILVEGLPAGRLYVARREHETHVIDISLLPEYRGIGIGGSILREVLIEAQTNGVSVTLYVERSNSALRLYRRLGFHLEADEGVYLLLRHAARFLTS